MYVYVWKYIVIGYWSDLGDIRIFFYLMEIVIIVYVIMIDL